MNDQRSFERSLADRMEAERRGAQLPDAFYDDFRLAASDTRQRPRWLALIKEPPMRISSSLAVGSPTARVAAIMVATLLLVLTVAGAGIAGGQLLAQGEDDEAAFPSGTFVAAEWSDRFVEFNEDGTCRWTYPGSRQFMDCTYAVEGDLLTETSNEWEGGRDLPPATYRWAYDGEYLTFELVGDDPGPWRRAMYQEQPYRYVPDPRLVVLAAFDIEPGTELLAGHTELRMVPGAEVPVDVVTDKDLATGYVVTVAIAEGQPITPDMLTDG